MSPLKKAKKQNHNSDIKTIKSLKNSILKT